MRLAVEPVGHCVGFHAPLIGGHCFVRLITLVLHGAMYHIEHVAMSMESPGIEHHGILHLCGPTVDVLPVGLIEGLGVGLAIAPELPSLSKRVGHALLSLGLHGLCVGLGIGVVAQILLGSQLHHALDIVFGEGVEVGEGALGEHQRSLAIAGAAHQFLPISLSHAQILTALRVEEIELCHRGHSRRTFQSAADGLTHLVFDFTKHHKRAVGGHSHSILCGFRCRIYVL